jgi:hypothetical protein
MNSDTVNQILTGVTAFGTVAASVFLNKDNDREVRLCHNQIPYPHDCFQHWKEADYTYASRFPSYYRETAHRSFFRDQAWGNHWNQDRSQTWNPWNQFNTNYYNLNSNSDIEKIYGIKDTKDSLTGLIDPKDVLDTEKLTPEAYSAYVINEARKGTQVINNGIIHDEENIPDPSYLIQASRSLQGVGASPVIALEIPNTKYTRKKLQEFMSNPEISGEEFIDDLYGEVDGKDNEGYHNPRIYKLLEAARYYRIPVAFIDGDREKIREKFKDGDYSYSRDDAMFDNVKKLTDNGYTVLTLLGLAHSTELTENRNPNKQEKESLINPARTLGSLLQDSSIKTVNLALISQNKNLSSSDLKKIENEDPTFTRNTKNLYLDFDGFDQAFRI